MISLQKFASDDFLGAIKDLFHQLSVPVNYVSDKAFRPTDVLKQTLKDTEAFKLIKEIYTVGIVDDAAFEGNASLDIAKIQSDYDGILIFGVQLGPRENGMLPTRSQLAELTRAFNREFYYTPVVVVFKYDLYIALANSERIKYKQEWREGEKAGKVSLLRDINYSQPHSGHIRIIFGDGKEKGLQIDPKKINSFDTLYKYWQEIFSVNLLNKKFYQELSNWYFWAIKHVTFPGEPTLTDAHIKKANLEDLIQEQKATNVIRLLTRILFVWFIKEKKLIPDDLFELKTLQDDILNDISPYHEIGMFKERNKESVYYKAILQNLFFATLNCPIIPDNLDKRTREFRKDKNNGDDFGNDWLYRYKIHFKNPDKFLRLMNSKVPFLNGGLFECLDEKNKKIYVDGFSDNMPKGEILIVPDYLFFGVEEETDLSEIVGISDKRYKQAAVKGLINILKSYKFTITENTPIEEEVALDPELLGKVFENLLASYNPETKTTARKQTGSFYTPREIVNYMVDESLIAYLKNKILSEQSAFVEIGKSQTNLFGNEGKVGQQSIQMDVTGSEFKGNEAELDVLLHELMSYNPGNPFKTYLNTTKLILEHLNKCTILDPACGSGAFPMGILQKMVHVLQKLDPDNTIWKEIQIEKAKRESDAVFEIQDKQARVERLLEINEAFDQSINDPDYARKLFLIENCIYGVDIQPIATQISKLRFFISLVVDQKVNPEKDNFGIRPLPNLETKFVAANTLIGIAKENSLFYTDEIKSLEKELKKVRHKLFSARTKDTKLKYRQIDKELRESIADILKQSGMPLDESRKLAAWDPYDQNSSSLFFDPEWMFDIKKGFDVVIGNPPYLKERDNAKFFEPVNKSNFGKKWHQGKMDFWFYFLHKAIDLTSSEICFITSRYWLNSQGAKKLINRVSKELSFSNVIDIGKVKVFDSVAGHHMVSHLSKNKVNTFQYIKIEDDISVIDKIRDTKDIEIKTLSNNEVFKSNDEIVFGNDDFSEILDTVLLDEIYDTSIGIQESVDRISSKQLENIKSNKFIVGQGVFVFNSKELAELSLTDCEQGIIKRYVDPNDVEKFNINVKEEKFIIYSDKEIKQEIEKDPKFSSLKKHLDYYSEFITSSNKPYGLHRPRNEKYFKEPKIIFKGMFVTPEFEFDDSQYYFGFSFSSIIKKNENYKLKYLLGILNSTFAKKWFNTHGKHRGAGVDIGVEKLRLFPIKKANEKNQRIIEIVVDCARSYRRINKSYSKSIENTIDALIFNIYFPDHMKEREIDVLEFVEQDINEEMQGREFEKLTDSEKEQVIEALHTKWSHPDNEVRNRIKLFAVRSPEILKPILES